MLKAVGFLILLCFFWSHSLASEPYVVYGYNKTEMQALNIQTLADLLRRLPLSNSYFQDNAQTANIGAESLNVTAIYKDGLPLFMDQNVSPNMQAISMVGIDSVEVHSPTIWSPTKGLNGIIIQLYSSVIHLSNSSFYTNVTANSHKDWAFNTSASISNRKHSVGWQFGRYFEQGLKEKDQRDLKWPSVDLHTLNLRYRWDLLANTSLELSYDVQLFHQLDQSEIFDQTSRTEDKHREEKAQRFRSRFSTQVSKFHKIELNTIYHWSDYYNFVNERDLYSGESEISRIAGIEDSTRYKYVHLSGKFIKMDSNSILNYALGLELSNFRDIHFKSIDAINVSYLDYVLAAKLMFKPNEKLAIDGGLNYISNVTLGNYVFPRLFLRYTLSNRLLFSTQYTSSAIYPLSSALYYPRKLTGHSITNNLRLGMGVMHQSHTFIKLNSKNTQFQMGTLYGVFNKGLAANYGSGIYSNTRFSRSLVNYVKLSFSTQAVNLWTVFAMKGQNSLRNINKQFYFNPEWSMNASCHINSNLQVFAFAKFDGPSKYLVEEEDGVFQQDIGGSSLLDLSLIQKLFQGKLEVVAGIKNVLDEYELDFTKLNIETLYPSSTNIKEVYADRHRNYFISLRVNLK
ncbi:MAG: hypothetical protein JXR19_06820 [Bacteroidia bacterium]